MRRARLERRGNTSDLMIEKSKIAVIINEIDVVVEGT